MGLDMHLTGRKFHWQWGDAPPRQEDGYNVENVDLRLGYWRKHPNLHGFIVNTFAAGIDDCREIELSGENLRTIVEAVKAKRLPHTTGFFFGASDGSPAEIGQDVEILERAIAWVEAGDLDPVTMAKPTPLGMGFSVAEVKTTDPAEIVAGLAGAKPKAQQRVSRSVIYRASW